MVERRVQPSNGQTYLLLVFAAFFAWGAPLICWGGVVDPSHGHAFAHFVFGEPRFAEAHHPPIDCAESGYVRGLPRSLDALGLSDRAAESPLSGAARPATVLSLVLISLFFVSTIFSFRPRITLQPAPILSLAFSVVLPIQTPPPR